MEVLSGGKMRVNNVTVDSRLYYYVPSDNKTQPSGAYIFRPDSNRAQPLPGRKFSHIHEGPVSYDFVYNYDYGRQTFRIMRHMPFIEHEFIVGPLPHPGLEVIARFQTGLRIFQLQLTVLKLVARIIS